MGIISQQIVNFSVNTVRSLMLKNIRVIARLSLIDWIAVVIVRRNEAVSQAVRQRL